MKNRFFTSPKTAIAAGLFSLVLLNEKALTQDNKGIGYHATPFLRITPAARPAAMGEAFSAVSGDLTAFRYNPAALSTLSKPVLGAHFHNWIDDTQQGAVNYAHPTRFGVFGLDFSYFNEGKINELDENFLPTGGASYSDDIMVALGYANALHIGPTQLGFGLSGKFMRQNLIGLQSSVFGLDAGLHFHYKIIGVSAALLNYGLQKVRFQEQQDILPQTIRAGLALQIPAASSLQVLLAFDAAKTEHETMRYYAGTEFFISQLIALRGGYKIHQIETSRWSAGLGLNIPAEWLANAKLRFDYAYSPLTDFDEAAHRFSLICAFGQPQRVYALGAADQSGMDDKVAAELEAAEKARKAAQEAEERTRAMEERAKQLEAEIARRLAYIQKIASESEGKIEVQPQTREKIRVTMRINFDFDKANIRPEEFVTMHKAGEILNTYPEAMIHVNGHTDWIGTDEYNIRLSHRRVDSVLVFLAEKEKVSKNRYYMPVGYGESRPIASNETERGRFLNRRVEFLLYTLDSKPEMPDGSAIKAVEVVNDSTMRILCNGKVQCKVDQLDKPYRLVVDIANTYLLHDITTYELNRGLFVRARMGYHPSGKFSRVVFDLNAKGDFDVKSVDNYIVIKVK